MRVKTGKVTYNVRWVHFTDSSNFHVGSDEERRGTLGAFVLPSGRKVGASGMATECFISPGGISSLALLHPNEKRYDSDKGRKISLTKAIKSLSKAERKAFWAKYFGR